MFCSHQCLFQYSSILVNTSLSCSCHQQRIHVLHKYIDSQFEIKHFYIKNFFTCMLNYFSFVLLGVISFINRTEILCCTFYFKYHLPCAGNIYSIKQNKNFNWHSTFIKVHIQKEICFLLLVDTFSYTIMVNFLTW